MNTTSAQAVIWSTVLLVAVIAGWTLVQKFREGVKGEESDSSSDYMSRFRELHASGELSDEEYKTIKLQLGEKLKAGDGTKARSEASGSEDTN